MEEEQVGDVGQDHGALDSFMGDGLALHVRRKQWCSALFSVCVCVYFYGGRIGERVATRGRTVVRSVKWLMNDCKLMAFVCRCLGRQKLQKHRMK